MYVPDRPVPPKLAMYISPLDLTHMPLDLSVSVLATWHRWRNWFFGLNPSGTVPICVVPHDPEIFAATLYMFIETMSPTRQNSIMLLPALIEV